MEKHQVFLGLGSNLGDRKENIERAVRLIREKVGPVVRQSSLIETEPWGFESDNLFLNGVVLCETVFTPRELLLATQQIERDLGRSKKTSSSLDVYLSKCLFVYLSKCLFVYLSKCLFVYLYKCINVSTVSENRYADRPIDIDILLYDDLTVDEPDLKIPHPLMQKRDFVMIPLREIMNSIQTE